MMPPNASLGLSAFRQYWHPLATNQTLLHDNSKVESLTKKLDTAEKKIIEYSQLIASLSADLKRYQDIICRDCRENVSRATSTSLDSAHPPSNAGSRQLYGTLSTDIQLSRVSQQSRITSPEHSDDTESHNLINPSPNSPRNAPLTTSAAPSHSIDILEPTSPSFSENPTGPSIDSAWSVEYNPEITQGLRLTLAETFTLPGSVFSAKFNRDGKYLAVGLQNGETHIYDMITGFKSVLVKSSQPIFYTEAAVKLPSIWALRFSLDNKYIIAAGGMGEIDIWEIGRRRVRASYKHKYHVRAVDLSPNGRLFASASYDNSVCVRNLRDGSRRNWWYESHNFSSVSFHPDGRYVAAGDLSSTFWVWDTRTSQLTAKCTIGGSIRFGKQDLRVMFTPDGKRVSTGRDEKLWCWDFGLLRDAHSISTGHGVAGDADISCQPDPVFEFNGHAGPILAICISSDSQWVVSSSRFIRNNVRILDARNGNWVCILKGHVKDVWTLDFSPAGCYLVSGSDEGLVRLWRYETLDISS